MTDLDTTDEIRVPVDLPTLRTALYVVGATRDFLMTLERAAGDLAAATDQYHDELRALVADEEARHG